MLQIISYVSLVVFAVLFVARTVRMVRLPAGLIWALYPFPGEEKGSHLQELNWWEKPIKGNPVGEFAHITKEILLFTEYYRRNRSYWYLVYPLHIAMFLFLGWLILLGIGALSMLAEVCISAGSPSVWGRLVFHLTMITGIAGLLIGIIACIGSIIKRLVDKSLRLYTPPVGYFNLVFLLAIFLTGFFSWVRWDQDFSYFRGYIYSLLTFNLDYCVNPAMFAQIILISLFMVYLPFTHMMHFVAKYFAFHQVRWDEQRSMPGNIMQKTWAAHLKRKISWSASHIQTGETWGDVITKVKHPDEKGAK